MRTLTKSVDNWSCPISTQRLPNELFNCHLATKWYQKKVRFFQFARFGRLTLFVASTKSSQGAVDTVVHRSSPGRRASWVKFYWAYFWCDWDYAASETALCMPRSHYVVKMNFFHFLANCSRPLAWLAHLYQCLRIVKILISFQVEAPGPAVVNCYARYS